MTRKNDNGKARWDLLPWEQLHRAVLVLTHGAEKYGDRNWQTVPHARERYFAALHRHLYDYATGATRDAKSGLHPLAHVVCNALFLLWFADNPPETKVSSEDRLHLLRLRLRRWLETVREPFSIYAAAEAADVPLFTDAEIGKFEDTLRELKCKPDLARELWWHPEKS